MSETRHLRATLHSVYRGPAWHGPSISENLEGVGAGQAASHPVDGVHSIWEIVHHVIAWEREVVLCLAGKPHVTMQGEDDWPPVKDTSEEAWEKTVADLRAAHSALAEAVKRFSEDDLEAIVPGRDFPWHVVLHGIIHHGIYHSGQIAILKKAATHSQ
jgi:uncharacterized damage-inducible protein DinB